MCLICILFATFLHAEEQDAANKLTTASSAQPKLPSATGSGLSAPLTIDQIRTNLPSASTERFEFLRRQRKITLEAIEEASTQVKTLTAKIAVAQNKKETLETARYKHFTPDTLSKEQFAGGIEQAKRELEKAKQNLDTVKATGNASQQELQKLENDIKDRENTVYTIQNYLNAYDQRLKEEEKRKQDEETKIKEATEELSRLNNERDRMTQLQISYQRLLGEIDDMVNQLFIASDATNSFKYSMSIVFSILVGIVIVGFFVMAWSNEQVKKTIFSNEAGIQFITLFAIVIAVILFGILNILEGKESVSSAWRSFRLHTWEGQPKVGIRRPFREV